VGATGATGAPGPSGVVAGGATGGGDINPVLLSGNNAWNFEGPTLTVTITSATQSVLVQSNASLYATQANSALVIAVSYQLGATPLPPGTPGSPVTPPSGLVVQPSSSFSLDDYGVSWVYTGLPAGTYQFGFVYGLANGSWDCDEVVTTAIVF
jgi:hypothetical protein